VKLKVTIKTSTGDTIFLEQNKDVWFIDSSVIGARTILRRMFKVEVGETFCCFYGYNPDETSWMMYSGGVIESVTVTTIKTG